MDFSDFLDSRFRGNDTPQPACPARGQVRCFIRLKCSGFYFERSQ